MARGFGSTYGTSDNNDVVTTAYSGSPSTFSIACWHKPETVAPFPAGRMVARGDSFFFRTEDDADPANYDIEFQQPWSVATGWWKSNTTIPVDTWSHVAVTYDTGATGNDPVFYVNGTATASTEYGAPSGTVTDPASAWLLGNRGSLSRSCKGQLAEVAIWNRILTAAEVALLGDGYSPLFIPNGLVVYEPLLRDNVNPKMSASTISGALVQPHPRIIYPGRSSFHSYTAAAAPVGHNHHFMPLLGVG